MARTAEEKRLANREACARYREKNRALVNEKARSYAKNHREERREYGLRYYYRKLDDGTYVKRPSTDQHREYTRRYIAEHRDQYRAHNRKRRALRKGAGGSHTQDDIDLIIASQQGICVYCRLSIGGAYHVDHIVPLSKGGGNSKYNIQLLCPACNLAKSAAMPISFAQSRGMLL